MLLVLAKKFSDVRKHDGDWQSSAAIHYLNTHQRCELHSLMMLWQTQRFRITPLILLISCHGDNAILRHDESGESCQINPAKKNDKSELRKKDSDLILYFKHTEIRMAKKHDDNAESSAAEKKLWTLVKDASYIVLRCCSKKSKNT